LNIYPQEPFQQKISDLVSRRVDPFTRDPDFDKHLENLFQEIRDTVKLNQQQYGSDWRPMGIAGLVFGTLRKSLRLWDIFIERKAGKDKLEDEFMDNLMIAVYASLYYKMLE
jgi:hypothetical protein